MPENRREGFFFIIDKEKLTIRRNKSGGTIDYSIVFNDFGEQFNIRISGKINVKGSEETFSIDETYPNSMTGAVLNTFNIREIIHLFNLFYAVYFSKEDKPPDNPDIDDYLNGNIKND